MFPRFWISKALHRLLFFNGIVRHDDHFFGTLLPYDISRSASWLSETSLVLKIHSDSDSYEPLKEWTRNLLGTGKENHEKSRIPKNGPPRRLMRNPPRSPTAKTNGSSREGNSIRNLIPGFKSEHERRIYRRDGL